MDMGLTLSAISRKKYPSLKIIMVSGFGSARDVALENGPDLFFEKPFSLDEFNEGMHKLLG